MLRLGQKDIKQLKLGQHNVARAYLGQKLAWQSSTLHNSIEQNNENSDNTAQDDERLESSK